MKKVNFSRCLDVGIRLCDEEQYYMVDDLEGIKANLVHSLRDDDIDNFQNTFKQLKDASFKTFLKDLELKFTKQKSFNHIIAETNPYGSSRLKHIVTDDSILGYIVKLPFHQFTRYNIRGVDLFAKEKGVVEIHVIDILNSQNIYIKEENITRGKNTILINEIIKSIDTTELFIGIRIKEGSLVSLYCEELIDKCGCDCDCEIDFGKLEICDIYTRENIQSFKHKTFCLNAALECSFEEMVCEYGKFFNEAYKYRVGLDILNKKINSYDRGWFIDGNHDIVLNYTLPKLEEDYYKHISLAITNVRKLLDDSICWDCDGINGRTFQMSTF